MRHFSRLAWTLAVLTLLGTQLAAEEPLVWESNLERAQQAAAQSNRLVLVHFWAPWCGWCKWMDAEVFARPEVAKEIQANYVPVKIDADQSPELVKKFGVSGLPTDVVLAPQGQIVNITRGKSDAGQYVARLNQCSANVRLQNVRVAASLPSNPPQGSANPPAINPPVANNLQSNGNANIDRAVATLMQNAPAAAGMSPPNAPPSQSQPPLVPSGNEASMPPINPPVALDGYCPVSLVEKQQWIPGDKRWGANHQGRTYLFTGPEEQSRFLANYDRYAPAASGLDIVLAAEERKNVPGLRQHGVFFRDRIFLFASEATLQKFSANPLYYMELTQSAPRQTASAGQQPR
jgi:thiol-disulfide isomerase/thioredoxin